MVVVTLILAHFVAPYAIIKPPKQNVKVTPADFQLDYEEVSIDIDNGQALVGYWTKSGLQETKGLMILLHGIGGCKEHFISLAKNLSMMGIDCLLYDSRAHGQSGGEYCTYGFYEKEDVTKAIDFVKSRGIDYPIGIWGNSMGGAIAIQSLAVDSRLEFGIVESTFTALKQIVSDYQKRMSYGLRLSLLSDYCMDKAGEIANFDPDNVQPIQDVKNIHQPMFIAHGDADENINVAYGKKLFENLASENKELVIVKDGGHFGLFDKGGKAYYDKIVRFINDQLD